MPLFPIDYHRLPVRIPQHQPAGSMVSQFPLPLPFLRETTGEAWRMTIHSRHSWYTVDARRRPIVVPRKKRLDNDESKQFLGNEQALHIFTWCYIAVDMFLYSLALHPYHVMPGCALGLVVQLTSKQMWYNSNKHHCTRERSQWSSMLVNIPAC